MPRPIPSTPYRSAGPISTSKRPDAASASTSTSSTNSATWFTFSPVRCPCRTSIERRRAHPQRHEQHLAAPPLLQAQHLETELVPIPRHDRLDIGHREHHVVDADDLHRRDLQAVGDRSRRRLQPLGTVRTWLREPTCATTARAPGVPHDADCTVGPSATVTQPPTPHAGPAVSSPGCRSPRRR